MLNLRQTYRDNRLPLGLQLTDDPVMNQELRLQLTNRPPGPLQTLQYKINQPQYFKLEQFLNLQKYSHNLIFCKENQKAKKRNISSKL